MQEMKNKHMKIIRQLDNIRKENQVIILEWQHCCVILLVKTTQRDKIYFIHIYFCIQVPILSLKKHSQYIFKCIWSYNFVKSGFTFLSGTVAEIFLNFICY